MPQHEQYELKEPDQGFHRSQSETDVLSTKSYHSQSSATTEAGKFIKHHQLIDKQISASSFYDLLLLQKCNYLIIDRNWFW